VINLGLGLLFGNNLSLANSRMADDVVVSAEDRSQLVKDILTRQMKMEDGVFSRSWSISTQNIEDMREPLLGKSGFHLISPDEIERLAMQQSVGYQVFKKFALHAGLVEVTVVRVAEGETCFSGYMKSEGETIYVYRQKEGRWVYERTRRSAAQGAVFNVKKKVFL
jgi:hypothetical protein